MLWGCAVIDYRPRRKTTRILLHCSHTVPSQTHDLKAFLGVKGRQMGLLQVGYHALILTDGRLIECRPHNVQGSHMRGKANLDSVGVCVEGGLGEVRLDWNPEGDGYGPQQDPEDNFTPDQWSTLRHLRAYLSTFYGELPLVGHSEAHPHHHRQCPPTNMERVRAWTT